MNDLQSAVAASGRAARTATLRPERQQVLNGGICTSGEMSLPKALMFEVLVVASCL